jgi:hypothetical protein
MSLESAGTTGVAVEHRHVSRTSGKIRFPQRLGCNKNLFFHRSRGRRLERALGSRACFVKGFGAGSVTPHCLSAWVADYNRQ